MPTMGARLRRWWGLDASAEEALGEGHPRLAWFALGVLYAVGATIGALSLVLPHPETFDTGGLWSNMGLAAATAALALGFGGRLPRWALYVALAAGVVLISRAIDLSGDGSSYYAFYYVWAGLYAFFFLGRAGGIAYAALMAASYAVVLMGLPRTTPETLWLMVMVTIVIGAVLVDIVVRRLRTEASRSAAVAGEHAALLAKLEEVARTDDLTGLPNRRAWNEALVREVARSTRTGDPLCVALIDLDRFKEYNDVHGHQAGDDLLKEISAVWRMRLRATDILVRYGGEEFAVALPACRLENANALLERLRVATPGDQTCSAGLVLWDGSESPEDLVGRADAALYEAKAAGRDRVVAA
jgi:diguanylate cyclase (GGDEF)-like protein